MINYPYTNLFCYPRGAGGKFLVNCVALNNRTVFQDHILAQRQLSGQFNVNAKLKYVFKHLKLAQGTKQWKDLELGDWELFGVANERYVDTFPELLKKRFDNSTLIQECMSKHIHLPIVCHNFIMFEAIRKIWTNSKPVIFTNYRKFLEQRNLGYVKDQKLKTYWQTIKGDEWPTDPPTTRAEIVELPMFIQHELQHNFHNEIERYLNFQEDFDRLWGTYTQNIDKKFIFDVEYAYANSSNFYNIYKEVCAYLQLPPASQAIINKYFKTWVSTINSINQLSEQE